MAVQIVTAVLICTHKQTYNAFVSTVKLMDEGHSQDDDSIATAHLPPYPFAHARVRLTPTKAPTVSQHTVALLQIGATGRHPGDLQALLNAFRPPLDKNGRIPYTVKVINT